MTADSSQPALEVFLVVESRRSVSDLANDLELQPTSIREFHHPVRGETLSEWSLRLAAGDKVAEVMTMSEEALLGIGPGTRERLNAAGREEGTVVCLLIVQRATDDPQTKGIDLSRRMVAWLADAGATMSIDQYYFPTDS